MHPKQCKRLINEILHTGIGLILVMLVLGLVLDPESILYTGMIQLIEWYNHI